MGRSALERVGAALGLVEGEPAGDAALHARVGELEPAGRKGVQFFVAFAQRSAAGEALGRKAAKAAAKAGGLAKAKIVRRANPQTVQFEFGIGTLDAAARARLAPAATAVLRRAGVVIDPAHEGRAVGSLAALTLAGLALVGCGAAVQPAYLVRPDRAVETRALPADPSTEALAPGANTDDFVEAQDSGSCLDAQGRPLPDAPRPCPARSGIVVGEGRAARDGLYRVRYRELRLMYEADRQVWAAHRELYEGQLQRADERIRQLQPNWWERNGFALGVGLGIVLTTIGVVSVAVATH